MYEQIFCFLFFTYPKMSVSGLAVMNRLARHRFQQSEHDFEDTTLDWDLTEM